MDLLFHAFVPGMPSAAGTQQSVRVCYFLARTGIRVHLHLASWFFRDRAHLLEFFGLKDDPNLIVYFYPISRDAPRPSLLGSRWHLQRLLTLLFTAEKHRYDVFYARGHRFPALHAFFKRWLGYKVVFELHEIIYLDHVPEDQLLATTKFPDFERYSFRHADGVMAISSTLKALAETKWGKRNSITVIHSGGMPFNPEPQAMEGPVRRIFFVGNYYPFSGLDDLVRAMSKVPAATLTVVGGGGPGDANRQRVDSLVLQLGLENRIEFRGFIEPAALPSVYSEADVLVIPLGNQMRCKYFMSPLKLFEYMQARRPIIASAHPTIREVLSHEQNALLTEAENPDSIAAAIRRLMEDTALAKRIAEQAFADAEQYSMPNKCAAIKRFLEEDIMSGDPGQRERGYGDGATR